MTDAQPTDIQPNPLELYEPAGLADLREALTERTRTARTEAEVSREATLARLSAVRSERARLAETQDWPRLVRTALAAAERGQSSIIFGLADVAAGPDSLVVDAAYATLGDLAHRAGLRVGELRSAYLPADLSPTGVSSRVFSFTVDWE